MSVKTIRQTDDYFIKEMDFEGIPITFRVWKNIPEVEIKADKYLAKANNFKSVDEMLDVTIGRDIINALGRKPEWLKVTEQGDFLLRLNPMRAEDMN